MKVNIDLAALARMRWIEGWKVQRLAAHFSVSGQTIKDRLRAIKKNPRLGGFKTRPPNIRGR